MRCPGYWDSLPTVYPAVKGLSCKLCVIETSFAPLHALPWARRDDTVKGQISKQDQRRQIPGKEESLTSCVRSRWQFCDPSINWRILWWSDFIYIVHKRQTTLIVFPLTSLGFWVAEFHAYTLYRFWPGEAFDICCEVNTADTCCRDNQEIPAWPLCGVVVLMQVIGASGWVMPMGCGGTGVLSSYLTHCEVCGALMDWAWRQAGAKAFS